jgi:hypothetical protein
MRRRRRRRRDRETYCLNCIHNIHPRCSRQDDRRQLSIKKIWLAVMVRARMVQTISLKIDHPPTSMRSSQIPQTGWAT